MYISEMKSFNNIIVISAICADIDSISGFPYVAVYYVPDYLNYVIVTFNIDLNEQYISMVKYNVRIFYI